MLPFLIAVFMTALGLSIAAIATGEARFDEEIAFAVIGIVFSSIVLLALFIMRVWPHRPTVKVAVARSSDNPGLMGGFVIGCCDEPEEAERGSADAGGDPGAHPGEVKA